MGQLETGWKGWADRRVRALPRQISCDLAGEAVVLQLDSGTYFGLNDVGAMVWERLAGGESAPTVAELRDALLESFEVDVLTCQRDLVDLIESMTRAGLVEVQGEGRG